MPREPRGFQLNPDQSPVDFLAELDDEQRVAAEALLGPICIIAGAGSGKTRTISHRIAHGIETGVYNASRVLALTYTNRAASELRSRMRELGAPGVQVRTFHSAALSQLQFFWPQLTETLAPKLITNKSAIVREALDELKIRVADDELRSITAEIEWLKYGLVTNEDYQDLDRSSVTSLSKDRFLEVAARFEALKQQRRLADWEDVLLLTTGLLRNEPRMLSHVQQQYRHFTVDEYQDISPLQQSLLETWLGDREELCVVGDPRQTIYTFAGADPSFLTGFLTRFPNAQLVELNRNYRSSPEIVSLANRISEHGELEAVRAFSSKPTLQKFSSASAEAKWIAQTVSEAIQNGTSFAEIAVLARINSQLELVEQELTKSGIKCQVRGVGRFFRRPEIMQAMAALRALQAGQLDQPLFAEVSQIISALGWSSRSDGSEKWLGLNWFIEVLEEFSSEVSLDEYLRELQERERSGHEPVMAAVSLATIHATKGLEWQLVILCGLNQGYFPISYAKTDAELSEERRLFYVGVTRAKDRLLISTQSDKPASDFLAMVS
jgi:DNA helicase-2/ATP-dependent DNA helicase PcrA